jgi:small-conductance mechanosensitive channel
MPTPPPQAAFKSFGDSSIHFELRAWTSRFERWPVIRTELAGAISAALRAAGCPFPSPGARSGCCAKIRQGGRKP